MTAPRFFQRTMLAGTPEAALDSIGPADRAALHHTPSGDVAGIVEITTQERIKRAAATCPELRVGDLWLFDGAEVVITRLEEQEALPWPMVHYEHAFGGLVGRYGAPAFRHGVLVTRGKGERWTPPVREAA